MLKLKRLYHRVLNDAGEPMLENVKDPNSGEVMVDGAGRVLRRVKIMRTQDGQPIVRGVVVKQLPTKAHKITTRMIEAGTAEGWLIPGEDQITIVCAEAGSIVFDIIARPCRRCLHCLC